MRTIIIRFASLLIVGGASLTAFFLIGKTAPPAASDVSRVGVFVPTPLVAATAPIIPAETRAEESGRVNLPDNLTNSFAQAIAEEILKQNPSGPRAIDGKIGVAIGNPDELIDRILDEETTRLAIEELRGVVRPGELIIAGENGAGAGEQYLADVNNIIQANQSGFSPRSGVSEEEQVRVFSAAVQKVIRNLLAVHVPAALASWHREILIMLRTQENALQAIGRSDEDPLKAIVALRSLREAQNQFLAANKKLNNLLKAQN